MGFIDDPSMVRVDVFKPSGKWYTTIALKWPVYHADQDHNVRRILIDAVIAQHGKETFRGWTVVCLEPYHEYSHPVLALMP